MPTLGLETEIVDRTAYAHSVERFREAGIRLPTFAQLADPASIPARERERLADVDPDDLHPANLFRVHWHNAASARAGGRTTPIEVPEHLVIPSALSGVDATIVLLLGRPFPMIRAHKVLAAYGCLAPRIVTGQFDPLHHRAIWPSTGNYCRGGVAISRIMGCRGVAVLPEGMSRERFEWLESRVAEPTDIVRTPGSESNVKEIYDECHRLDGDPDNIIFNQFSEMGNHLVHWLCTGTAAEKVFEHLARSRPGLRLHSWVSASGSAGTLGAGDLLKERHGAKIVVAEALECPTLLENGFGEHNIQGIGDKHVPLIHHVGTTDFVAGVSDRSTDALDVLFNSDVGRSYLVERRGISEDVVAELDALGFSSICNLLAAIKTAKHLGLTRDDVVLTVATDGAEMYRTEHAKALARDWPDGFDRVSAGEVFGEHLAGVGTDHLLELTHAERRRIFNLEYFTWVEQQGLPVAELELRRTEAFWDRSRSLLPAWDALIERFNAETGLA